MTVGHVEHQEATLSGLVEARWHRAEIGEELRHLADVDRVQVELWENQRLIARHDIWARPPIDGRERGWTVRLGLLGAKDVDLLARERWEPAALLWAGRMVPVGPAAARSVVEVLPSVRDAGDGAGVAMPPVGLLSWPVEVDPPWDAVERGFVRWATAVEQAHALCAPSVVHQTVVNLECRVASRTPPLRVDVRVPWAMPGSGAGTTIRLSWDSARSLWASFGGRLTLSDALLCGLCTVQGDVEAFLRLVNPWRGASRGGRGPGA